MSYPALKNILRTATIILVIFGLHPIAYTQGGLSQTKAANRGYLSQRNPANTQSGKVILKEGTTNFTMKQLSDDEMSQLQKMAREYRRKGLELQKVGNLDGAMALYEKAIELDPFYGVTYNDLGILYETKGDVARAEQCYLMAIKIDPNYLSAYSNLALVYENSRDLKKAAFYWAKRADLGSPDDPWTQRARSRLQDIRIVTGEKPIDSREQEVIDLVKEVAVKKSLQKQDTKDFAMMHFEKAKAHYKKGEDVLAIKEAFNAKQLDPSNKEIEEFIQQAQTKVLSK